MRPPAACVCDVGFDSQSPYEDHAPTDARFDAEGPVGAAGQIPQRRSAGSHVSLTGGRLVRRAPWRDGATPVRHDAPAWPPGQPIMAEDLDTACLGQPIVHRVQALAPHGSDHVARWEAVLDCVGVDGGDQQAEAAAAAAGTPYPVGIEVVGGVRAEGRGGCGNSQHPLQIHGAYRLRGDDAWASIGDMQTQGGRSADAVLGAAQPHREDRLPCSLESVDLGMATFGSGPLGCGRARALSH